MSRLPSFGAIASGNAQLLQSVLIPRACNTIRNNQPFWGARADLSNIGTLRAETIIATNFSGGTAGVIGDKTTGIAIAGDGSRIGDFDDIASSNIAGFGTRVLGGYGQPPYIHGKIADVVVMGDRALEGGCNVYNSVFIGTWAGRTASGAFNTVAVGDRAGYEGKGSNNVYIGTNSGAGASGSGNVFIGSLVGSTGTDLQTSNTLYIGNQLGTLLYGNFSNKTLGVNVSNVDATFDVSGTTRLRGTTTITASLGVNMTSPTTTLDVSGTTHLRGNVIIDGDLTVSGGPIGSDVCTGQVILGIGASSRDYPSLIAVRGGLQVSEGFIQLNRMGDRDALYRLDVSASARITGGSLIGGITLSGTNLTTPGAITISGAFNNLPTTSNSIGGVSLSGGNVITLGSVSISGAFNNLPTTSNSVGGVTLNNSNVSTSGTITGVFQNAGNTLNSIGGVTITGSTLNDVALVGLREGIFGRGALGRDAFGGYLTLNDTTYGRTQIEARTSPSETQFNIYGPNDVGQVGSIRMYGSTGRISNLPSSSNSIGGVTLSTGRLSGSGFRFDISGSNAGRLQLLDTTNQVSGIEMYANDYNAGGGTIFLRSQGLNGTPQVQIRSRGTRGDSGGGQITLMNQNTDLSTCVIYGDSGEISNVPSSSNSIGGVTLGPNGTITGTFGGPVVNSPTSSNSIGGVVLSNSIIFAAGSSISILQYLVLGHGRDEYNENGNKYDLTYNFQYTGSNSGQYRDIPYGSERVFGGTDFIYIHPRVRIDIFSDTAARGTMWSFSNTNNRIDIMCNVKSEVGGNDKSYRAYFI